MLQSLTSSFPKLFFAFLSLFFLTIAITISFPARGDDKSIEATETTAGTVDSLPFISETATNAAIITQTQTATVTPTPSYTPLPILDETVPFSCSLSDYSGNTYTDSDSDFVTLIPQDANRGGDVTYRFDSFINLEEGKRYRLKIDIESVGASGSYEMVLLAGGQPVLAESQFISGVYQTTPFDFRAGMELLLRFSASSDASVNIKVRESLDNCPTPTPTPTATSTATPTFTPTPSPTPLATSTPIPLPQWQPPATEYLKCNQLDLLYVVDRSGSMSWPTENGTIAKIDSLKAALTETNDWLESFGDQVDDNNNRYALASFATGSRIDSNWTEDTNWINERILDLVATGTTNMAQGFEDGVLLLQQSDISRTPLLVLVSDGVANQLLNPTQTGDPIGDALYMLDQISTQTDARIFAVAMQGSSSFDITTLQYGVNLTGGELVEVRTDNGLLEALKSYLKTNCDFVDLEVSINIGPQPVQLEERLSYEIFVTNNETPAGSDTFHQPTNDVTVKIDLNSITLDKGKQISNIEILNGPNWDCQLTAPKEITCQLNPNFALPPDGLENFVAEISARVPGRYFPGEIGVTAEVDTNATDTTHSNDLQSQTVEVKKEWVFTGLQETGFSSFTHVQYDDSVLSTLSTSAEAFDYKANETIINPLQVPLQFSLGAEIDAYPRLVAAYCQSIFESGGTPPAGSCVSDDHYMDGSLILDRFELDYLSQNIESGTSIGGVPQLTEIDRFLLDTNVQLGNRDIGSNGRYVENDPDRCTTLSLILPGECQRFIGEHDSTVPLPYQWLDSEYVALNLTTSGGRDISCADINPAAGACFINQSARPGIYIAKGNIYGNIFFYDEVRLKTQQNNSVLLEINDGNGIEFESAFQLITTFIEQDR